MKDFKVFRFDGATIKVWDFANVVDLLGDLFGVNIVKMWMTGSTDAGSGNARIHPNHQN